MATVLYLVRHCESSGQEPGAPLTARGRAQAEALADLLHGRGVERIVASPYRRAVLSAEPIARRLGLPVETDHRLVERVLSAEPLDDWREHLRVAWDDFDRALPGGESSRAATERGLAAIHDVLRAGRRRTAVVSHGNLLALLLHAFDGRPGFATWATLTNPDVFEVHHEPAPAPRGPRWRVTRLWTP